MSKCKIVLCICIIVLLMTGCSNDVVVDASNDENLIEVEGYKVQLALTNSWEKNSVDNPYDLYCTDGYAFMGVFVYDKADLSEGQTPLTIYDYQIKDIFSQRKKETVVAEKEVIFHDGKAITSTLYSAEHNGTKNYYYCNLVEFEGDENRFVWIIFTGLPTYARNHIEEWKSIVSSIELNG